MGIMTAGTKLAVCLHCDGTGRVREWAVREITQYVIHFATCEKCNGLGLILYNDNMDLRYTQIVETSCVSYDSKKLP